VDKNVDAHGSRAVAQAYLEHLYSTEAQNLIAKHHYRPRNKAVAAQFSHKFPQLQLLTIEDFGRWKKAQPVHFGDGGIFDKIYQ
jgi:sulfate transport system substrate-binding protein